MCLYDNMLKGVAGVAGVADIIFSIYIYITLLDNR